MLGYHRHDDRRAASIGPDLAPGGRRGIMNNSSSGDRAHPGDRIRMAVGARGRDILRQFPRGIVLLSISAGSRSGAGTAASIAHHGDQCPAGRHRLAGVVSS